MPPKDWTRIHCAMWDDEPFLALSPEAKLVFVFSWTHSRFASMTGIDRVSAADMAAKCSLDDLALDDVLAELGEKPFVKYDWDHELLWTVNRLKYVGDQVMTTRLQAAILKHLTHLPTASPLVKAYKRKYRTLLTRT